MKIINHIFTGVRIVSCCETMKSILNAGFSLGAGGDLVISVPEPFTTDGFTVLSVSACPNCHEKIEIINQV